MNLFKVDRTTLTSIDDYIAGFPRHVQERLRQIRAIVKKAAPKAEETIKYRIPTFVLHENLVHFAAFAHHIGLYPTTSGIRAFRQELQPYKHAKGSVQFPLDRPVPLPLIRRIVQFRVKEVRQKFAARQKA